MQLSTPDLKVLAILYFSLVSLNLSIDGEDSLLQLRGASFSYRIALGPQQGQKVNAVADKLMKLVKELK